MKNKEENHTVGLVGTAVFPADDVERADLKNSINNNYDSNK